MSIITETRTAWEVPRIVIADDGTEYENNLRIELERQTNGEEKVEVIITHTRSTTTIFSIDCLLVLTEVQLHQLRYVLDRVVDKIEEMR